MDHLCANDPEARRRRCTFGLGASTRRSGGARVIAGATDLFPAAGERRLAGDFVDIADLAEIGGF